MLHMTIQFSSGMMAGQLARDFHLDAVSLTILMGMVFYPNILLQIPAGIITDRFGARRVLSLGAFISALGAYGFACSQGFYSACFFRVWMGSGLSFSFVSMAYLIANWMPRDSFSMMFSIAEMIALTFSIFAMRYMASILPTGSWRDFVLLIVYMAAGLSLVSGLFLRDKPEHIDDTQPTLSFIDLLVQLKFFMMDVRMWANGIYSGLLFACLSCFVAQWGPTFLFHSTSMSMDMAASMCSMITFGLIVACPFLSFALLRINHIHLVLSLSAFVASICLSLVVLFPMMHLWLMRVCLFSVGFFSVAYLTPFTIAHYYVRAGSKSTAIGFTNMLSTMFGPLLSFLIALLVNSHSIDSHYTVMDYQFGMYVLPIGMFIAGLICFIMPKTHRPGMNHDI